MRPRWQDVLFGAVFVAPPFLKKVLLRVFLGARIAPTARIGWFASVRGRSVELGEHSAIGALTLIRCDGDVRLGRHSEVSSFVLAYGAGGLWLGDHSYVGPQCLVNADEDVHIGDRSALGPRCMVFTHGSFLPVTEGYPVRLAPVTIGDRAWLAAGVFVHPGVRVGDDVIVNSRAVVSADVPSGTVAEGAPARPLFPIERVKRRMTPARVDETMRQVLARFAELVLRRGLGLDVSTDGRDILAFVDEGTPYRIVYLPSSAPSAEPAPPAGGRLVVLSNASAWKAPADVAVLDLATGRTTGAADPVAGRLVDFLKRYYGVRLECPVAGPSPTLHPVLTQPR